MKTGKTKVDIVVKCEGCGRKIPKERLKAIPDTVLCVQCATESENEDSTERIVPLVDYDPSELLDAISSDD
jgi:ribosomal protein S26